MKNVCKHCGQMFSPHCFGSNQKYCNDPECRRARKRLWQKTKMANDIDYRTNQESARKAWQERNPDYMREYRKRSPEYVEKNRMQQRKRNKLRKSSEENFSSPGNSPLIVKMDELKSHPIISAGIFRLVPVEQGNIVKMDEQIVHLVPVSDFSTQKFVNDP